jgi:2-succinyl-6-hydroxy-2,4-cyclohexadiene-1-carboxylate synthase
VPMETLVLLHGFAGTGAAWDGVVGALGTETYRPLAPDLPGHGRAGRSRPCTVDACVERVLAVAPDRFALAGYSMGGRVALHVALRAPERVTSLGLVSTTPGIEEPDGRDARLRADGELADWIASRDVAAFADRWLAQPLFAEEGAAISAMARADIARNTPAGLSASLREAGTGAMAPVWDRLVELSMPSLIVVGERDAKFREIGGRMAASLPDARTVVIPDAGHALPREAPAALAAVLAERR